MSNICESVIILEASSSNTYARSRFWTTLSKCQTVNKNVKLKQNENFSNALENFQMKKYLTILLSFLENFNLIFN